MISEIFNHAGASVPAGKRNKIQGLKQTGELKKVAMEMKGFFRNYSVIIWWESFPVSHNQPAVPGIRVGNANIQWSISSRLNVVLHYVSHFK